MSYEPDPLDTSKETLTPEIEALSEKLAKHAHEIWAQQRMNDDWSHGETHDQDSKQHPALKKFEELDPAEKDLNRLATQETLKWIVKQGYRILPPSVGDTAFASCDSSGLYAAQKHLDDLQKIEKTAANGSPDERKQLELPKLLEVWATRANNEDAADWCCLPELYRHISARFLKLGEAPLAKEVAQSALEYSITDANDEKTKTQPWAHDIKLRQTFALALARTGNSDRAQELLLDLKKENNVDNETLGLLARTYKDQAFQLPVTEDARKAKLVQASELYREAWETFGDFWTGINVATIARLLGNSAEANQEAATVRIACEADLKEKRAAGASDNDVYWHLATLGEVGLNLGDFEFAEQYYRQAVQAADKNFGDINSTRRHARWLLEFWIEDGRLTKADRARLDEWLPIPKVVVFGGHMIDQDPSQPARFPAELEEPVNSTIKDWLKEEDALVGYSSASCGSDLLFQKAIQDMGGESRIVLPYNKEQFQKDCVDRAGTKWSELFTEVTENATQLVIASPHRSSREGVSYNYSNLVLHGLATVRATELGSNKGKPVGLVVWNGQSRKRGGTAGVVRRWRDLEIDVDQIDVSAPVKESGMLKVVENPTSPACETGDCDSSDTRIMAMIFGDAVNFGKLDEDQVGLFIEYFMKPIADIVNTYGEANVVKNTWGDGLYLVFNHIREAGLCALDICDFVKTQIRDDNWTKVKLPAELGVRIALHAGPVLKGVDPITKQLNYTGTHVSRAARLEPKTPPGEVYASQAFAALCAEQRVNDFTCDYVKQLAWAKQYGSFPTFSVNRRKPK
jgi:class 3 adenylate cyclase